MLTTKAVSTMRQLAAKVVTQPERPGAATRPPSVAPVRSEPDFDAGFYVGYYGDLAHLSHAEALGHWSASGRVEGRAGNRRMLLSGHRNADGLPPDFDIVDYIYMNPDLVFAFAEDWRYVLHFLEFGIAEGRAYRSGAIDIDFVSDLYGYGFDPTTTLLDVKRQVAPAADPVGVRIYASRHHALRAHGLGGRVVDLMDPSFYARTNGVAASRRDGRQSAACIVHFCEHGLRDLRPLAPDLAFDPAFYHRFYGPGATVGAETSVLGPQGSLYRNWLTSGAPLRAPNRRAWFKARTGADLASFAPLQLETYRQANVDLAALEDDTALAAHLFESGLYEKRFVPIDEGNAEVFAEVADVLAADAEELDEATAAGRPPKLALDYAGGNPGADALRRRSGHIFRRIAQALPGHATSVCLRAKRLLEAEAYPEALAALETTIEARTADSVMFRDADRAATGSGNLAKAVEVLAAAIDRFPGDPELRERFRWRAREHFGAEWSVASALASAGRHAEARERIGNAARLTTPPERDPAPGRPIRSVALVANIDLPQCRLYRVEQKIEHLRHAGYAVRMYEVGADLDRFRDEIAFHQAVIFYRVAATPGVTEAIADARGAGLVTFYEIDDIVFDPALFPDTFADYGGMVTRQEYGGLHLGVPLFAQAMALCDYGIASTPALVDRMSSICRTGRVFLYRNAFGLQHERWAARPRKAASRGPVTIFYGSGTKAHTRDFAELVEPALERICARYGDRVRVLLVGHVSPGRPGSALAARIEMRPVTWNLEEYWSLLSQADINLAVLRRTELTDAKSEIKWLEAAVLRVPSVVSSTRTFDEVIDDGVDGLLCRSSDDFHQALDKLVADPGLRTRIGEAAYAKATERYGTGAMAANARSILEAVSPAPVEKPRILIVNVFYPPQAIGGATRVVADNVRDLRARHHDAFDIEVFTSIEGAREPYVRMAYGNDGARVVGVKTPVLSDGEQTPSDERMGAIFERHLVDAKPDLIHFHCVQRLTASIVHAANRQNIPYVITIHDAWWISSNQFLMDRAGTKSTYDYADPVGTMARQGAAAAERMEQFEEPLKKASAILAVSEPFAQIYRRSGVPNVVTLPNGVSPILRRQPRPARTPVVLAHVGGLEVHKGYELFRDAVSSRPYRNLSVVIVDHAKLPGYSKADAWGTTPVQVVGKLPQTKVHDLYGRVDVLVAPSLWEESFGLVTREALAAGCWAVASDRGAIGEPIVEGQNGHVVDVSGIAGLVSVLERIEAHPEIYTVSPPPTRLRTSADQADDLAALYRDILQSR